MEFRLRCQGFNHDLLEISRVRRGVEVRLICQGFNHNPLEICRVATAQVELTAAPTLRLLRFSRSHQTSA